MYLSAAEAAAELGISRSTLYAYVSRRGIRSIAVEGSKERLYWKSDVLEARRPKGRPRQSEGLALPLSSISLISETALLYRGVNAVDLAEKATVEEAAALLWDLPEQQLFTERLPLIPDLVHDVLGLMKASSAADRAIAVLPLIEEVNPRSYDFSHAGLGATGVDVLRCVTAIVFGDEAPRSDPMHVYIGHRLGLTEEATDFVRRSLILSAEHGFEPGSVAVRGAASIGVSPYRSVAAGLLLLSGRQTQIGRINGLARLIDEIQGGDPEAVVIRRLREGDPLPGFGFHKYADGDPRAHSLMHCLETMGADDDSFKRLKRSIAVVHDALGKWPDFALILQYGVTRLLPETGASLFMLGRCVGWIAHAIEQFSQGEAVRPHSLYTGPLPTTAR